MQFHPNVHHVRDTLRAVEAGRGESVRYRARSSGSWLIVPPASRPHDAHDHSISPDAGRVRMLSFHSLSTAREVRWFLVLSDGSPFASYEAPM